MSKYALDSYLVQTKNIRKILEFRIGPKYGLMRCSQGKGAGWKFFRRSFTGQWDSMSIFGSFNGKKFVGQGTMTLSWQWFPTPMSADWAGDKIPWILTGFHSISMRVMICFCWNRNLILRIRRFHLWHTNNWWSNYGIRNRTGEIELLPQYRPEEVL